MPTEAPASVRVTCPGRRVAVAPYAAPRGPLLTIGACPVCQHLHRRNLRTGRLSRHHTAVSGAATVAVHAASTGRRRQRICLLARALVAAGL